MQARGVKVADNLKISDRAHLVMPYHKLEDELAEQNSSGATKLGTTKRGIGPCYSDRASRRMGIRFGEIYHPESFREKLGRIVEQKNKIFQALYANPGLDADEVFESHGVNIVCDPKSYLYLNGTEVDYSNDLLKGGFVFNNPNASGTCSCGASFST